MYDTLVIDSILDKSTSYYCVLNAAGTILTVNSKFARLLGYTDREALKGKVALEASLPLQELHSFFSLITSDQTEIPGSIVQAVHRTSEKTLWIKFDLTKILSSENGPCLFISGIDVTQEVLARREAEQKAHERSGFLVRMGHELRTPLNTVLGYAQLLQGLGDLSPVAREYVHTIISNEYNILHLLNDMFELAKHEAGQTAVVVSETNVKKIVNDVTRSFIDQFNEKYLSLTVEYKTDIPELVLTDQQKIAQVIANLVSNALKFTRKGGVTITISWDRIMTVDIEDTGTGIDPEDQSTIFDVFAQTGSSKEHMTGSGIGLAVARIFARLLGGDVMIISSRTGSGSLFRFTFDAPSANKEARAVPQISDYTMIQGISKPCKVLLVDDVDINLSMLEIFLGPAGFEVDTASNGNEAVRKFKEFKPDIVFMDLIMPEKDGFEATREIKEINRSVPVIALTASIVDSVKELALESGVNGFMNKPFVPERFFEIIAEHTGISYITAS